MSTANQYLRVSFAGSDYLLPGGIGFSIEQRENLRANTEGGAVTAWLERDGASWPALYLTSALEPARGDGWQRAVFIEADPVPIGLLADDIELLGSADVHLEPFVPLGAPAGPAGHLFSAAWIQDTRLTLVFDAAALIGYLKGFVQL